MRSSGGSGAAVASWPRPGHGLDLPMGERRTGKSILEHVERAPRTIHPALGPLAAREELPRRGERPAPRPAVRAAAPAPARTSVDVRALAAEYAAGASLATLATRHGRAQTTIRDALTQHGVVMRPASRIGVHLDGPALAEAYRAGATINALAAEHHAANRRITEALREQGVQLRAGGPDHSRSTLDGAALAARHRDGASIAVLAAEHRVGTKRIAAALREQGITLTRGSRPTQIDVPAILAQRAAGVSTKQIAADHGISLSTVQAHLAAAGATPPPRRADTLDVDDLVRAYTTGASTKTLATQHGVARATITRLLRDAGVTIRPALSPRTTAKRPGGG